jgi:hypothetical protein
MMEEKQPFFVRGIKVGTVDQIESHPSFKRGILALDDCPESSIFDAVVSLARKVDIVTPEEYQACWEMWRRGCDELQDLHLWIGNGQTQIEEFAIESDWSIEWQDMEDFGIG